MSLPDWTGTCKKEYTHGWDKTFAISFKCSRMKGGFVIPIRSIVLASGGSSATIAFNKIGRLTPMSRPETSYGISKKKCITILATLDNMHYFNVQIWSYHIQHLKIIVGFMIQNQSLGWLATLSIFLANLMNDHLNQCKDLDLRLRSSVDCISICSFKFDC